MIARDEEHVLIVYRDNDDRPVKCISLGYRTLDGNEYCRLSDLATVKGYYIQIQSKDGPHDFDDLVQEIKEL